MRNVGRPLAVLIGLHLLLGEVGIQVLSELLTLAEAEAASLTLKLVRFEQKCLRNHIIPTDL